MNKNIHSYTIQKGMNNPVLRQKSVPVTEINDDIRDFSKILMDLMWKYDGVGLAAPQVGENIRMIAVTYWILKGKKYDFSKELIMINPEIIYFSQEKEIDEEGCLSLPGRTEDISRAKEIKVKYTDINGKEKTEVLDGLNARIIQHEIDHLDGILFPDRAEKKAPLKLDKFIKL